MKKLFTLAIAFFSFTISQTIKAQDYDLNFDGSDDYVVLPSAVQPSGSAFSAEAWIKIDPAGGTDQKILMNLTWSGGAKGFGMSIYKEAGGFTYCGAIYIAGTAYFSPNSDYIPTGTWTHIALTWSQGGNLSTYLNGHLVGTTAAGSSAYVNSGVPTYMGTGTAVWAPFKGMIDEVRIWSTTRTGTELHDNMNKEMTGTETGLYAYYKMSSGSGTTLYDNKAGGGNNGTFYNHASWVVGTSLPVQLMSFNARPSGGSNIVYWTTAYECSNSHFDLERSTDGERFTEIGTVYGYGDANEKQYYAFRDDLPLAGVNYYRLHQVDQSGKTTYSSVIRCNSGNSPATVRLLNNPVTGGLLDLYVPEPTSICIMSHAGQVLLKRELPEGRQILDCSYLLKGYYTMQTGAGNLGFVVQ